MNDRLQALSDQGVSIWLDDISRERLKTGNLADLIKDTARRRRDLQPDDLRQGARRRRRLRGPGQGPRRPRRRPRRGGPGDHHLRRALGLRRACATSTTAPTGRTAGSPSRSTRASRTDTDATIAEARALWWMVDRVERDDQDPGHPGGPAGHHRGHGRGHQRQRHADLQPGPLPRGDGRLPHRARAGARPRASTCRRSARSRRSSSAGSTPRSTSGSTRSARDEAQGAAQQGRDRQRPARLRGVRGGLHLRPLDARSRRPARNKQRPLWASTSVKDPACPTRCTSPTWSRPTPSTRCPRRPSRRPPTTARSPATRSRRTTTTPTRCIDGLERARHLLRRRGPGARGRGRGQVREVLAGAARHRHRPRSTKATAVRPPLTVTHLGGVRRARRSRSSPTRSPASSAPRTPRSGARTPSPRPRSGSAGSTCPRTSRPLLAEIDALRAELWSEGLDRVVLCGMGGSSLAPEVISRTSGVPLDVLDSTDPQCHPRALERRPVATVVVVSSKSGGTLETDSQRRAFVAGVRATPGSTPPRGSSSSPTRARLEKLATEAGYRKVFLADPTSAAATAP